MEIHLPIIDFTLWSPFLIMLATSCLVLLLDLFMKRETSRIALPSLSIIGCLLALLALYRWLPPLGDDGLLLPFFNNPDLTEPELTEYPVFLISTFSRGCMGAILIGSVLLLMLSQRTVEQRKLPLGEYYGLFMLATSGMIMLAASVELLTLFINIEIVSIAIYVLVGIERRNPRAGEASLKYFILGAFASGFLIFGAAFFYGYAHTTFLIDAAANLAANANPATGANVGVFLALALILAGFAFKLTLAPFHLYAADVYDGAPTPVAALLATGVKVAGFCALAQLLILMQDWAELGKPAASAMLVIALISVVLGNAVALSMKRIKRLLAYSSIAHSGYLLLGILILVGADKAASTEIKEAIEIYLLAYVLMTVLAFGVVASLGERYKGEISNYKGLARQQPFMAAAMTVALVSLTGLPPTIGFVGKLFVFAEVVKTEYLFAAIVAVLASVMSAFYYLRVVVTMYMVDPEIELRGERALANGVALGLSIILIFLFGIFPNLVLWLY